MFTFTDMAVSYSVDELDDLTSRKVAPEGIDGDRMARIIRARRGAARATLTEDNYANVTDSATINLWGDVTHTDGNRRMVAVGRTVTYPVRQLDARHESRTHGLGATLWSLITRK